MPNWLDERKVNKRKGSKYYGDREIKANIKAKDNVFVLFWYQL